MLNAINDSPETRRLQRELLAEIKKLTTAVKDENALMAGNEILWSLQKLELLRTAYADAAWAARCAYFNEPEGARADNEETNGREDHHGHL